MGLAYLSFNGAKQSRKTAGLRGWLKRNDSALLIIATRSESSSAHKLVSGKEMAQPALAISHQNFDASVASTAQAQRWFIQQQ